MPSDVTLNPLRLCPPIAVGHESEKVSHPEDQRVHQTVDAGTLEFSATAVLHQLGVWACKANA